mgnify:CR=1 FL=1
MKKAGSLPYLEKSMNIFVVDSNPYVAARSLPDKLLVKMPVESSQMLAVAFSEQYGVTLPKKDGSPYKTNGFRNHPCTLWVRKSVPARAWLIAHALELCSTFEQVYGKPHGCLNALQTARTILEAYHAYGLDYHWPAAVPTFVGAFTDPSLHSIPNKIEAYRKYISLKPYAHLFRDSSRIPSWLL